MKDAMQTARRWVSNQDTSLQTNVISPDGKSIDDALPASRTDFHWMIKCVLGFLVVSLSTFRFPSPTSAELDPSWQLALGYFLKNGLLAGVDYVFPYGPLGYFWSPNVSYYPPLLGWYLCWWTFFSGSFALLALFCASKFKTGFHRIGFLGTLSIIAGTFSYEVVYFTFICAAVSLLLSPPPFLAQKSRFLLLLSGVVSAFAFLSLTKFSILIAVLLGLVVSCSFFVLERRFVVATSALLIYLGVSLSLWLLAGQNIGNIDDFLWNTLQVAAGYSPGMSLPIPSEFSWICGLGTCCLALLLSIINIRGSEAKTISILSGGYVLTLLVLAFKGSFVRAFGIWFFGFAFCAPLFLLRKGQLAPRMLWAYRTIFVLYQLTAIIGLLQMASVRGQGYKMATGKLVAPWLVNISQNIQGLLFFERMRDSLNDTWTHTREEVRLPAVRRYVGSSSIDLFPNEPAVLILNGFHYTPRPAFQSYMSYTEALQDLNLKFYRSKEAPRFVLFRSETIDGRFPIGDDGKALQFILENYQPILREDAFILFEKSRETSSGQVFEQSVEKKKVPFDFPVEIPTLPESNVGVRIKLRKSPLGRALELVHSLPHIGLELQTAAGEQVAGKLVPGIAESGILLSPLLPSTEHWVDYFLGTSASPATQLQLRLQSPIARWIYEDSAELEFYRRPLSPPDQSQEKTIALKPDYSGFFSPEPTEVKSLAGRPARMRVEGKRVILLHAPSFVRFPLPAPGTYRLHAEFGIMPGAESALDPALRTDGVVFSFRVEDKVVAARELHPTENANDRLPAELDREFHLETPSTLSAEAQVGSNGNSDWSYWKNITVTRVGN